MINLPIEINPDRVQANFRDGLLTWMLPKADHARRRIVKISTEQLTGASERKALDVASEDLGSRINSN